MGKFIDRIVLCAALGTGLFLLFLMLLREPFLSGFCALLCCAVLIRRHSGKKGRGRMSRIQAQEILTRLAFDDDDAAEKQIIALLKPDENHTLCYLPRHPDGAISVSDVYSAWKRHRGSEALVLAAVCHTDPRAGTFARTLRLPRIEIADASRLLPLIRRSDIAPPRSVYGRAFFIRLRSTIAALPLRYPPSSHALYGLMLGFVYMLTGTTAYLFLSAASLFLAAAAWRMRRAQA